MEEALRCKAVAAAVGEINNIDLTASRRLQLAAEQGGATGFLLDETEKSFLFRLRYPLAYPAAAERAGGPTNFGRLPSLLPITAA
jgi:hypothetical protein